MAISPARGAAAAFVSLLVHAVLLAVAVIGLARARAAADTRSASHERVLTGIVWIPQPGGGERSKGGGGSGDHTPAPVARLELPGNDAVTLPVGKPPAPPLHPSATEPPDLAPPIAQLDISALNTAGGTVVQPGSIDGVPAGDSLGPGTGGRAGSGNGPGDGPGTGAGHGTGSGGEEGGGTKQAGPAGLRDPQVLRQVKPAYTPDAMRAKIQGTAVVECVVLADGTVGEAHVVRSVDSTFGLDQEAVNAARRWLFQPATLKGQPVAMRVFIELTFVLR